MIFKNVRISVVVTLLLSGLIFSCGSKNENNVSKDENKKADSLSIKLNSPELKAVNAELLKDPSNAANYSKRAMIYLKLGQLPEATGDAIRSVKIDSTKAEYYLILADIYFSQNKTKLSKETLEIIEKKFPDNTEAQLKLAELYFLVQDYQSALDHANKALKVDNSLAQAYFLKGNIYRESGDTAKAISNLITTIEQDNKFVHAFQDLGVIYGARRNPIAFDYYNNALKLNPENTEVKYGIAKLLQDLGKTDEAIVEYLKLSEKKGACINCLFNLGVIYLETKKDSKKALDFFTKAISEDPSYLEAYLARGLTYTKLKDKNAAKADYEMCLRLQPNYSPALKGLNEL